MKLNLDLQCVNSIGTGIAEYANTMIMYLQNKTDMELYGYLTKLNQCNGLGEYSRFKFPVKIGRMPISVVYSRALQHPLPFSYEWLCGNKADINLYFTWAVKRVRHHGITIATIHDLIALRTEMENQRIVNDQQNDLSYTLKYCDYIMTVSERSKKDIMDEFRYPIDRIKVIPNGISFEKFNTKCSDEKLSQIRRKYHLPEKFILYLGGMRKHKNIERLIKSYSYLPKNLRDTYKLVITKGTEHLKELVSNFDIEKYVVFTPFIDETDKTGVYQLSSLYAFISLYEGFGIPIIEAQAAGIPVITSNVSSLPEIAGNSALCVNPVNVEEIAEGMEHILTDSKFRQNLIISGYVNAQKYSVENAGKKLYDFLKSLG